MTDDVATQILKKLSNLEQGQTELRVDFKTLADTQTAMKDDIKTLSDGQAELRGDIKTLQEGQTELRGDVKTLTEDQAELKVGLSRLEVLLEDTNDRLDATQEVVGSINATVSCIPQMAEDIAVLKSDNKAIKLAVTATNQDLKTIDRRVTRLETITAA